MGGSAAPDSRGSPLWPEDLPWVGDYRLLSRLGEGGMGRVYLARSPAGQLVALKLIRTDVADRETFRRRFRSEVDRVRQVPPFCTAEVLDADPDHDPPYLVVEYVDGPDLATVVRERGPLSPANLHGLAIGVATALTAIHGAGVIHRDLKAANVLLAPGSPKVIDFGLARAVDPMVDAMGDTSTGELIGTVAYMAPERIEPAGRDVTPAADIFAWGGVIVFAGTGKVPFTADSLPSLAVRILTEPPELGGLTGDLRELVKQALAKDPADRPTARELLDRLLTSSADTGVPPPASRTELLRTGRRYAQVDPDDAAIQTAAYPTPAATLATRARRPRTLLLLLALGALLAVGPVAALTLPFGSPAGLLVGPAPSAPPTSAAPGPIPAGAQLIVRDPLAGPGRWEPSTHELGTNCSFADGSDATFDRGRVGLGVLQMRPEVRPPYRVRFANVEVWGSASGGD